MDRFGKNPFDSLHSLSSLPAYGSELATGQCKREKRSGTEIGIMGYLNRVRHSGHDTAMGVDRYLLGYGRLWSDRLGGDDPLRKKSNAYRIHAATSSFDARHFAFCRNRLGHAKLQNYRIKRMGSIDFMYDGRPYMLPRRSHIVPVP